MDFVSPHFHVVEDKPPYVPAWVEPLPDPYDAPIWTAARRADADVIVTQNLKDGPPPDERGLRVFDGVLYLDPIHLPDFLAWWGDYWETNLLAGDVENVVEPRLPAGEGIGRDVGEVTVLLAIRDLFLDVERRRGGTLPASDDPERLGR